MMEKHWPEPPPTRFTAQAEGTHPAPCATHCEANAFEIELRVLRGALLTQRRELARMRRRIEWLRGALKTTSGRLLDLGELEAAEDCMLWAGDMEPQLPAQQVLWPKAAEKLLPRNSN